MSENGWKNLWLKCRIESLCPTVPVKNQRVGDAVSDRHRRIGTVTHIIHYGGGPAELVIEWEDGTVGIRYRLHEVLMLVERLERNETVSAEP